MLESVRYFAIYYSFKKKNINIYLIKIRYYDYKKIINYNN
jgi:hypothetical protein